MSSIPQKLQQTLGKTLTKREDFMLTRKVTGWQRRSPEKAYLSLSSLADAVTPSLLGLEYKRCHCTGTWPLGRKALLNW